MKAEISQVPRGTFPDSLDTLRVSFLGILKNKFSENATIWEQRIAWS